ncbi:nucleoside-diphosphate sugar epimerase/dehydratase [Kosmotoga pacifica]|uniref:Polysaccharide biosynthesis protein n=1 Tax=Kosmotoga pacifica TaxID=1330330 RepID=A0A0G2Z790_9BACT|nr:nucleoside-diphosphate sugar epimerase/dehydratase [Kosmotoga pacifica]AKI97445.1 polysaccharide biosynthesis protein [Kosmotoga pacifica]
MIKVINSRELKRFLILAFTDYLLIYGSYALGMYFRYGIFSLNEPEFFQNGAFFSFFILLSLILNGTYRVSWSYANFQDFWIILRGTFLGYVVGFFFGRAILLLNIKIFTVPLTVSTMTFIGSTLLIIWSRIFWLTYLFLKIDREGGSKDRLLIIGAGDAGTALADEIMRNPSYGRIIGFLDDSPRKQKKRIHGLPVLGSSESVMELVEKYDITRIIIAIPSATSEEIRRIMSLIDLKKVRVQTLPGLAELMNKKANLGYLREISVDDLLGREAVSVDREKIRGFITEKKVLVTGAGGSIGSELCRQIAGLSPSELFLLGKGENSVYEIEEELKDAYPELKIHRIIADIQDETRMEYLFSVLKPQLVFHAAAHKHVPIMEENPTEAFRVNTLGTYTVAKLAEKYGTEAMVMISTDKAVNPSSIMGVSKRLAEEVLRAMSENSKTKFAMVRFGNVLGSRGSVVPKFKKQIQSGGPITVTDPRMTRYFMTIPEAVSLVLQAGAFGSKGEVFVLDMGKPIKVSDLARDMITLAGYVPDQEIEIKYTGIRPGEKLFERLSLEGEEFEKTSHPKIFKLKSKKTLSHESLGNLVNRIKNAINNSDFEELNHIIEEFVPDATARIKRAIPELRKEGESTK